MAIFKNATTGNDVRNGPSFEFNQFNGFGIGSDTLTGGTLSDVFIMSVDANTDVINGGGSIDRIDYSRSNHALTIALDNGRGSGTVATNDGTTVATLTSIEDAIGSSYGDSISGSNVANVLDGGAGNDTLYGFGSQDTLIGGAGNDTLDGGSENDTLVGGAGMDTLLGGSGVDTVVYSDASIGMNIWLDAPLFSAPDSPILTGAARQITATGGLVNEDTLTGIENVIGSAYDDVIKSNGALNTIDGGNGNDVLQSWVDGQNDVMNGGEGSDTIDYSAFGQSHGLVISLGGAVSSPARAYYFTGEDRILTTHVEDTFVSIENVIGTSQDDTIAGNNGVNVLNGSGGNDFLWGVGGGDTLTGGTGSDTFQFWNISDMPLGDGPREHITDFEHGIDHIDLSGIDANVNAAGDQSFVIVDAFTGVAGQLTGFREWRGEGQAWVMDVDGDGTGDGYVMVHSFDGSRTSLTSSDFIL